MRSSTAAQTPSPSPSPPPRLWRGIAAAVSAGVLFALSCPPVEIFPLAWLVPAVLMGATRKLRLHHAALCGVVYAVTIGSLITSWAPAAASEFFGYNQFAARAFIFWIHTVNPGIPCALMLVAYASGSRRVGPLARPFLAATLWVASEWMRTWSLGWEILAHSQFRQLWLIQISDLGGAYLVSFLMTYVSVALGDLVVERRGLAASGALARIAPAAVLTVAAISYSAWTLASLPAEDGTDGRTIAVVQGNIPNQFRWKRAFFGRTIAKYAELTGRVADENPDLMVWPENAVSFYLNREGLLRSQLHQVAAKTELLLGAPRRGDGNAAYNSAYLLGAGQTLGVYDKQILVPFGEYDPFPWFGEEEDDGPIYRSGGAAVPLQSATLSIAPFICFEILYPGLVSDMVRQGADIIVNLSNDTWMDAGDGWAPRQHFSMAVFRAVETRRYLVRAASNGVSGFVAPSGRIGESLPPNVAGTIVDRVEGRSGLTPYVRWGDSWLAIALALSIALAALPRNAQPVLATPDPLD